MKKVVMVALMTVQIMYGSASSDAAVIDIPEDDQSPSRALNTMIVLNETEEELSLKFGFESPIKNKFGFLTPILNTQECTRAVPCLPNSAQRVDSYFPKRVLGNYGEIYIGLVNPSLQTVWSRLGLTYDCDLLSSVDASWACILISLAKKEGFPGCFSIKKYGWDDEIDPAICSFFYIKSDCLEKVAYIRTGLPAEIEEGKRGFLRKIKEFCDSLKGLEFKAKDGTVSDYMFPLLFFNSSKQHILLVRDGEKRGRFVVKKYDF